METPQDLTRRVRALETELSLVKATHRAEMDTLKQMVNDLFLAQAAPRSGLSPPKDPFDDDDDDDDDPFAVFAPLTPESLEKPGSSVSPAECDPTSNAHPLESNQACLASIHIPQQPLKEDVSAVSDTKNKSSQVQDWLEETVAAGVLDAPQVPLDLPRFTDITPSFNRYPQLPVEYGPSKKGGSSDSPRTMSPSITTATEAYLDGRLIKITPVREILANAKKNPSLYSPEKLAKAEDVSGLPESSTPDQIASSRADYIRHALSSHVGEIHKSLGTAESPAGLATYPNGPALKAKASPRKGRRIVSYTDRDASKPWPDAVPSY